MMTSELKVINSSEVTNRFKLSHKLPESLEKVKYTKNGAGCYFFLLLHLRSEATEVDVAWPRPPHFLRLSSQGRQL